MWILICNVNWCNRTNVIFHVSHVNCLSPVWIILCTLRWIHTMYTFPQISSPLCGPSCVSVTWQREQNPSHKYQIYLFMPVWVLICFFRVPYWVKDCPYVSHLFVFSSVCVYICSWRVLDRVNDFPHVSHLYGFFTSVSYHMFVEITHLTEWLPTIFTFLRLPFCMSAHMFL